MNTVSLMRIFYVVTIELSVLLQLFQSIYVVIDLIVFTGILLCANSQLLSETVNPFRHLAGLP